MIHARAAFYALGVVDLCRIVFVNADSLHFAGNLARTFLIDDCAVRANLCARTALFALGFVNVRNVLCVERDCAELAHVFASVRKTTAACARHFVSAHRALVASDVDHFDCVGILLVTAHCELDALCKYGALFVHATAHGGHFAGDDALGDVDCAFRQSVRPRFPCHFAAELCI